MRAYLPLLILLFAGCERSVDPNIRTNIMGYVPVYASGSATTEVKSEATPRPTTNAGKIYAYGNYLFQVEQNEGIHIIDNSNPQSAKKIGFIRCWGASEIAIRANFLYTNNIDDLVVIDLANAGSPKLVNRVVHAFPQISREFPSVSNTYFECPDPKKGTVIGWKRTVIDDPKCYR